MKVRQPHGLGNSVRRSGIRAGPRVGAGREPCREKDGDGIAHDREHDDVEPLVQAQSRGHPCPEHRRPHAEREAEDGEERTREETEIDSDPGRSEGSEEKLAFRADIPHPAVERDGDAHRGQDDRDGARKRHENRVAVSERAADHARVRGQRIGAVERDEHAAEDQAEAERQNDDDQIPVFPGE